MTRHETLPGGNEDEKDASAKNARRSRQAIRLMSDAERVEKTAPRDVIDGVLKRHESARDRAQGLALLEPARLVQGAGEAIPALGLEETSGRRDAMVDTLERPTTVGVRASEHRLELLENAGVLQPGLDAAETARAANSIEKMLAHQIAAAHKCAMTLLADLPSISRSSSAQLPSAVVEVARLGNTAARLMEVCVSASLALQRLKTGGTQRVIVQHQQLVVANQVPRIVVNAGRTPRRGRRRTGKGTQNGR